MVLSTTQSTSSISNVPSGLAYLLCDVPSTSVLGFLISSLRDCGLFIVRYYLGFECHPERSEGSPTPKTLFSVGILRCAQDDNSALPAIHLMMGLVLDLRATSLNPALRNAEGKPVQANAGGISFVYGSTG